MHGRAAASSTTQYPSNATLLRLASTNCSTQAAGGTAAATATARISSRVVASRQMSLYSVTQAGR